MNRPFKDWDYINIINSVNIFCKNSDQLPLGPKGTCRLQSEIHRTFCFLPSVLGNEYDRLSKNILAVYLGRYF